MAQSTLQKYDCSRCGFSFSKVSLKRQRGMLLCSTCYDNLKKIKRINPRWESPRDNSTTTTAVNTPTIFSIGTAGVTQLSWSRDYTQDGQHLHYYMEVQGDGGAVDITTSPQIVSAGSYDRFLTLRGNSNTNTILLEHGSGLALKGQLPMLLSEGDAITFAFVEDGVTIPGSGTGWGSSAWGTEGWGGSSTPVVSDGWVECSRTKGGI